jgi:leader peptidase (prepilin peptidase)/N-methyltransferase
VSLAVGLRFISFVAVDVTIAAAVRRALASAGGERCARLRTAGVIACAGWLQARTSMHHGGFVMAIRDVICIAACAAAAVTDLETGYIFDTVTYPAAAAIAALSLLHQDAAHAAAGAAAGGGALSALYALTRRSGIGLGDVKLACCSGLALGAAREVESLGIAFVAGGTYAAYLLLTGKGRRGDALRFAPYMAAGVCAVLAFAA